MNVPSTIRDTILFRQREARSTYSTIRTIVGREDLPAEYRKKIVEQATANLRAINDLAQKELAGHIRDAAVGPTARIAEGPRLAADELAEASLVVEQYRGNPNRLSKDLAAASQAGATRRLRVLGRAALSLGVINPDVLGGDRRYEAFAQSDPEIAAAMRQLEALDAVALAVAADIARERAEALVDMPGPAGVEGARASIRAKVLGERLGMLPGWAEGKLGETSAADIVLG